MAKREDKKPAAAFGGLDMRKMKLPVLLRKAVFVPAPRREEGRA